MPFSLHKVAVPRRPWLWAVGLALITLGVSPALAGPPDAVRKLKAKVRYVADDMVYLSVGRERGVAKGDVVTISRRNQRPLRLQVASISTKGSAVRVTSIQAASLKVGQRAVVFVRKAKTPKRAEEPVRDPRAGAPIRTWEGATPTWGGGGDLPEGFRPLLAPITGSSDSEREGAPAFLVDGRVTLSADAIQDEELDRDWQRLRAYGAVEFSELGGTDWRLVTRVSANAQFEDDDNDIDDSYQARLHELFLAHEPLDNGHRFRLGRFFFDPLPQVGQIDGAHAELRVGESPVYFGAAGGFRPDARQEQPNTDRGVATAYGMFRTDHRGAVTLDARLGYFGTQYRSQNDRSAIAASQYISLFRWVTVVAQQTVDIYDSDDRRSGTRLTRAHVNVRLQLQPWLYLGGGYDQNELPDTIDNRKLFPDVAKLGDTRSQRSYAYAGQRLPAGWHVNERVSLIRLRHREDQIALSLGASKFGVFSGGDLLLFGYRGVFGGLTEVHSGYVELLKELPSDFGIRGRYSPQLIKAEGAVDDEDFLQHRVTLGVEWDPGSVSASVNASTTFGDDVELYHLFASVTWRF